MLPCFLFAMYERTAFLEKVLRNIIRTRFLRPTGAALQNLKLIRFLDRKEKSRLQTQKRQQGRTQKGKRPAGKAPRKSPGGEKRPGPRTAQQTLPYREMLQDGICRVDVRLYTKSMEYEDIQLPLAQADDQ